MNKFIIFTLILLINFISPVNANEDCTNLSQEQIQSSIDKAIEGKTPSEVSVEAIINQINQDFNTNCTQEQFFNLQKNALENGKCLAEFEFNEFYKVADNFVNGLVIFKDQAESARASTQKFMADIEGLNLGPIQEIQNIGNRSIEIRAQIEAQITVLNLRIEEINNQIQLTNQSTSEDLTVTPEDDSTNARLGQINDQLDNLSSQIDELYSIQGAAFEVQSSKEQIQSLNNNIANLQSLISSASEEEDTSTYEEEINSTLDQIAGLEGVISERESITNGLTVADIENKINAIFDQMSQLQSESESIVNNLDSTDTPPPPTEETTDTGPMPQSDDPLMQELQTKLVELDKLYKDLEAVDGLNDQEIKEINASIDTANLTDQSVQDLYLGIFIELKTAADYLAMLEIHDRAFFNGMLRVASNCDAEHYKSNGLDLQYGKLIKKLSDISSILEATANELREVAAFEASTFNALKQKYASIGLDFNFMIYECPIDEPNCEPPPAP